MTDRVATLRRCYGTTMIRDLIGRLGPGQELRIIPREHDQLEVSISNHVIMRGKRNIVISFLEDWFSDLDNRDLSSVSPDQCSFSFGKE